MDPSRARGWESFCAKLSVAMTVPQASSRGFLDRDDRTGEFSRETGLTRISRQTAFTKSTLVDPDSRDAESLRSAMSEEPDILQSVFPDDGSVHPSLGAVTDDVAARVSGQGLERPDRR